jgi:multidrug efflux pump subunit AcrB
MFRHVLMTTLTVVTAAIAIAVQSGQVAFAETAGSQSTGEVTPQSCSSGVVLIGADGKPVCG